MPVDPTWLEDYIRAKGPYVYHSTDLSAIPSILRHGLVPWNRAGSGPSLYKGERTEPRPNHSYLASADYIGQYGFPMLRIDLRKLDPAKVNPDEDHFDSYSRTGENGQLLLERHGLTKSPPTHAEGWNRDEYPTLGEWSQDLLHPDFTHHSLWSGSISVDGGVPPEAIEFNPEWEHDEDLLNKPFGDELLSKYAIHSGIHQPDQARDEIYDHWWNSVRMAYV